MTPRTHHGSSTLHVPVIFGVLVGVLMAAAPLAFWWLPAATVYSLGISLIAAVYIGFAVAGGRRSVITVEITVATVFVLVAAIAATASPWLLVAGLAGHGAKDLWQHRTGYVANTRWWPPFCVTVDWVAAVIMTVAISAGASFH
jgi:fucose 4-O-acetylase-like acetyltransferase